jgi:hypothetical protein
MRGTQWALPPGWGSPSERGIRSVWVTVAQSARPREKESDPDPEAVADSTEQAPAGGACA